MKKIILFLLGSLQLSVLSAQAYTTSGDIYLGLKKLNVLGSVLYVAAHPDDENTRLISYFSKDKLYRTGYLSLTRGDGGQNLIGDEQGIELGLIRTQELLGARRIDGGEQFFTRAFDFGYSKTPQETFTKWDKEKILSDVVWVIRKFQPDVILTRFPATGEGGHGHHTASAILANEAFTAAADPKRFPEQLKYVSTWQAKRILWNGFNFNNATPPPDAFKIDVGGYNPVLGKSYGEIAAESRSQHKSQGFGSSGNRGEVYEFFRPVAGPAPQKDLFEDVETGWRKINAPHISKLVDEVRAGFDFLHPEKSVKSLVQLYKAVNALPASTWKAKKLEDIIQLVEACSGLFADATTNTPYVAQTDSLRINFTLNNRLGSNVIFNGLHLQGFDSTLSLQLNKNINHSFPVTIYVPPSAPVTQPYWLANEMKEGYYQVSDQQLIGEPDVQPAFTALFHLNIEGQTFPVKRKVRYRFNDPVKGEVYQPFAILPPYTISFPEEITVLSADSIKNETHAFDIVAQKNLDKLEVFTAGKNLVKTDRVKKGERVSFENPLHSFLNEQQKSTGAQARINIPYYADQAEKTALKSFRQVNYDHIPRIYYFKPGVNRYVVLDVETAGKKIGYIVGAGDKIPEALTQMGYDVTLLSDKELAKNNLQQFDAIITGVRAYNTNEWLNQYYDKLMTYVRNGGNLIVQYNTSNNIGPVRAKIGPYSFDISRTRITDENAAVTFLKPEHQVLNFPNKITENDFTGWIQERSIYHAGKMDSSFQSILHMSDPGEQGDGGSLIIAKHGKGYFTYTGLVFFRELPAGVPGAYRLMANLIALNRKKEF